MILDIKDFTWDAEKRQLTSKDTWELNDCPSQFHIQGKDKLVVFDFHDHHYNADDHPNGFDVIKGAIAIYVVDKDDPNLAARLNHLTVLIPWKRGDD